VTQHTALHQHNVYVVV